MKSIKTLVAAGAAAASLGMTALPANAAVEASVGAASLYLFRGQDAGGGSAALFGDVTVSDSGFYASAWASSASSDSGSGGEVDFLAGYAGEYEGVCFDIGAVNYVYAGNDGADSFGDYTEAYLGLSYGDFEVYYYKEVADGSDEGTNDGSHDYEYYTISYTYGAFTLLAGKAEDAQESLDLVGAVSATTPDNEYTHIDLTWAATDNLSFTVSKIVDIDDDLTPAVDGAVFNSSFSGIDDDAIWVVNYTLPVDIK